MTANDNGTGMVAGGAALFGVHVLLSWYRAFSGSTKRGGVWAPVELLSELTASGARRSLVDAVSWALLSWGLMMSLRGTRSWAHDDDILAICAVTAAAIWASTPDTFKAQGTKFKLLSDNDGTEGSDEHVGWNLTYAVLRGLVYAGGFLMLAFIAGRGKPSDDRKLSFAGAIAACVGQATSRGAADSKLPALLVIAGLVEIAGWALLATGAQLHNIDLDSTQGFDLP